MLCNENNDVSLHELMRIGIVIIAIRFVTSVLVCPWTLNLQHQVPSVFPLPAVMLRALPQALNRALGGQRTLLDSKYSTLFVKDKTNAKLLVAVLGAAQKLGVSHVSLEQHSVGDWTQFESVYWGPLHARVAALP